MGVISKYITANPAFLKLSELGKLDFCFKAHPNKPSLSAAEGHLVGKQNPLGHRCIQDAALQEAFGVADGLLIGKDRLHDGLHLLGRKAQQPFPRGGPQPLLVQLLGHDRHNAVHQCPVACTAPLNPGEGLVVDLFLDALLHLAQRQSGVIHLQMAEFVPLLVQSVDACKHLSRLALRQRRPLLVAIRQAVVDLLDFPGIIVLVEVQITGVVCLIHLSMIDRWIFSLRYISDIIILCRKFYGGTPLRFTGVPLKFYGGPAGGFQLFRLVFRAAPGRSRGGLAGGLQLLLRGEQVEPAGMALVDLLLQEADADQLPDHLGGAGGRDPQQLPDLLPGEDGVDLPGLVDPLVFPAEVGAVVEQGVQHLCVAGKPAQERLLEQEGEELKILALDGAFGCGALGLGHGVALPFLFAAP